MERIIHSPVRDMGRTTPRQEDTCFLLKTSLQAITKIEGRRSQTPLLLPADRI